MTGMKAWFVLGALALGVVACSGKTERGMAGEAPPADKPAAGPAQLEPKPAMPAKLQPAQGEPARHLLMVVELEPATHLARTLSVKAVELPLPRRRGRPTQEAWRVEVLSAAGASLYSAPLPDAATVRAEFPDAQGKLSGATVQKQVAGLTLRLPLLKDATTVRVLGSDAQGAETELARFVYPQVAP